MASLSGCAAGGPLTHERVRLSQRGLPSDGVVMDIVLVERPLGDRYLHEEVWACTDEHAVSLEQKAAAQSNGFRVGQLIGLTPAKLQALLANERSCVKGERQYLPAGGSKTILVSPILPRCDFKIARDSEVIHVHLENAQCGLVITPTPTDDGRTRLRFTPQVQFGESSPQIKPANDRANWEFHYERQRNNYPDLAWEVILPPNTFVLIGTTLDESSLGCECFAPVATPARRQRLLVIRTSGSSSAPALPPTEATINPHEWLAVPPLAHQASAGSARVRGSATR